MEAVGVASSIAGLINLADVIISHGLRYIKDAKDANNTITSLLTEVTSLRSTFNQVEYVMEQFQQAQLEFKIAVQSHDDLESAKKTLNEIQICLHENLPSEADNPLKSLGRRLLWPFKSSETKELTAKIERHKSAINLLVGTEGQSIDGKERLHSIKSSGELANAIAKYHDAFEVENITRERREMLRCFGDVDPRKNQYIAEDLRKDLPTGSWFLDGDDFRQWLNTDCSKLLLTGIPGAGKTVLMSTIVQNLQKKMKSMSQDGNALAFFYCDYQDAATHDPWNILGTIIKQLALQSDLCVQELENFYKKHNPGGLISRFCKPQDLCHLIRQMSSQLDGATIIIIDALDEINDKRSEAIAILRSLNDSNISTESNIKTLFTSRDEVEITTCLSDYRSVSVAADTSDLQLYVKSEIQYRAAKQPFLFRTPKVRDKVLEVLVTKAGGMFRWVSCQIDYLCTLHNDRERLRALEHLPPTLKETYERILRRIPAACQPLVRKAFQWIIFAKEPLSAALMMEALAISEDDEDFADDAVIEENALLQWCSSLIRKSSRRAGLELAHFTVKEFLLSIDPVSSDELSQYRIMENESNILLARTCLTYLNFKTFEIGPAESVMDFTKKVWDYPFLLYASQYWDIHAFGNFKDTCIMEQAHKLFRPAISGQFKFWNQCAMYFLKHPFDKVKVNGVSYDEYYSFGKNPILLFESTTPLHWAACLALEELCEWLLPVSDPNRASGLGTPLNCAVLGQSVLWWAAEESLSALDDESKQGEKEKKTEDKQARIDALLEAVAENSDSNASDRKWRSKNRMKTIDLLVKANAQVDCKPSGLSDRKLLELALCVGRNDPSVVSALLSGGAKLTTAALRYASKRKDEEHGTCPVEVLALIEGRTEDNLELCDQKAFHSLAADLRREQHESLTGIVSMTEELLSADQKRAIASLLKKDAQHGVASGIASRLEKLQAGPDRRDYSGDIQEAFRLSVRYDWPEIVKIFLDQEIEIEPAILAAAVMSDSADVIESFIKRGNHASQTDLFLTIELGRLRILKFLIDDGIDLSKPDPNGDMPLHRALKLRECCMRAGCSRCGPRATNQLEIAELLMEHGADVAARNADGDTPLHLAAASGLDDVVEFLLSRNAPLNDENDIGQRPLTQTTIRDCDKAMELLLRAGADINAQRLGVGGTALHYACSYYAPRCLQMLLDCKADTERLGTGGFPAINLAAFRGRWDAVEKLIYFGVNINWRESDGTTLLHYAIQSDKEDIVKLLLERDPEIEAQDFDGKTALIIAATRCHMPILEMLLKYNANINKQRNDIGGTALHYAVLNASSKEIGAVQLLICSGADLEIRGQEKQTALFMAAARGRWHAVIELTRAGANVHFRDDVYSGMTTLLLAAQNGQSTVLKLLLQRGADPSDKKPFNGATALMLACQNGDLASARILLQNGAEVDAKTENDGSTALLTAAGDGRKDLVELLLKHGANVNTRNSDTQQTVLMLATKSGDLATVECVLDHGAEIDAQRKSVPGNTALSYAVLSHHQEVVESLLKRGANFHLEDSIGRTIVHQLARDGDLKTLEPFLSRKVNWTESEGAEFTFAGVDSKGVSALHLAAKYGNKDFIATLFDRQLLTHVEPRCGNDFTPLHWAAHAGKVETTQALLSRGASVDAVTSDTHKTALHYAAEVANLKTVAALLNAGASIDIRDTDKNTAEMLTHDLFILRVLQKERLKRESPQTTTGEPRRSLLVEADSRTLAKRLLRASEEGDIVLCRQLIANGADIEGGPDAKCSPLIKALKKGHDEVAKLLIDKGADLHRGACQKMALVGYQALHFATFKGGLDLVQWILSKNPRMSDRGVEPIHIAAIQGKTDCLIALLDHERRRGTGSVRRMLDVQVLRDKDLPRMCLRPSIYSVGSLATGTPLHLASWAGATETVKLLLRYGAGVDAVDSNSRTPLHQACVHAHLPVLKLLLEAGASVRSRDCEGYTPLSLAVRADSIEAIDLLLERKSDKDVQDRYGRTCPYLAMDSVNRRLPLKFLEFGMNFNVPSHDGDTALHRALSSGHPELIQFGIDHAPVPDVPQKRHGSILNVACAFTSGSLVKVLLSRAMKSGIEDYINHFSPVYGTPLYAASYRGDVETVEALLNAGATIDAQGGPLGTAFDAACSMGREKIVVILLRNGANPVSTNPEEPTLPFTSPFDPVRTVLLRYLEKGLAGLDDALEAVSEPITKTTSAAVNAAIEAEAAVFPPDSFTCDRRSSTAIPNSGAAETEHLSHIVHLPTTPTPRGDNSAARAIKQPDPSQTKTVSFATSTVSSPIERKSSHSLLGPTNRTILPTEPISEKVLLHQRQFTLTGLPPKYGGEACVQALIDPDITAKSIRELDTPTLLACSDEAVTIDSPSPTTPSLQDNVVNHLTQVESTMEDLHLKTTIAALTDPFILNPESEVSQLGKSPHP